MDTQIPNADPPWPREVTEALIERSILSLAQVIRIGELDNGLLLLSRISGHPVRQWREWLDEAKAAVDVTDRDVELRQIAPDELLTAEMVDFDPRDAQGEEGEKDAAG